MIAYNEVKCWLIQKLPSIQSGKRASDNSSASSQKTKERRGAKTTTCDDTKRSPAEDSRRRTAEGDNEDVQLGRRPLTTPERLRRQPLFTMKKPFPIRSASKIWGGLTDAFNHHHQCEHNADDKVQLLSLLANRSFELDDSTTSSSSEEEQDRELQNNSRSLLRGRADGEMSSDDEEDGGSSSVNMTPPLPPPPARLPSTSMTSCHAGAGKCDSHSSPPSDPEMLSPSSPAGVDYTTAGGGVSAPTCVVPPLVAFDSVTTALMTTSTETTTTSTTEDTSSERAPTMIRKTASTSPDDPTPSELQWTFTLYDVDRKGTVTKEDIESLVYSIYEALSSIQISSIDIDKRQADGKPSPTAALESSSGGAVGALKVKLSVVSESNRVGISSGGKHRPTVGNNNNNTSSGGGLPSRPIGKAAPAKRRAEPPISYSNVSTCGSAANDGRTQIAAVASHSSPACQPALRQRIPSISTTQNGVKFRAAGPSSPSASKRTTSYPNGHRLSMPTAKTATLTDGCDHCDFGRLSQQHHHRRAYINLADLETCCSRPARLEVSSARHRQPSPAGAGMRQSSCRLLSASFENGGGGGETTTLKHCDRHCTCEDDTKGAFRHSLPVGPKGLRPACGCAPLCCVDIATADRRLDLTTPKGIRGVKTATNKHHQSPPPTADAAPGGQRAKSRQRRRDKSMRQVQEWIRRETANMNRDANEDADDETKQEMTEKRRSGGAAGDVPSSAGRAKVPGGRRSSRLTVEHRHYHEHRHVVLPAA